jgi:hypothetical protein
MTNIGHLSATPQNFANDFKSGAFVKWCVKGLSAKKPSCSCFTVPQLRHATRRTSTSSRYENIHCRRQSDSD